MPARLAPHAGHRGALAFAFAVTMVGTTLPTPLYGLYRAQIGFSQLMLTVIFSSYAVGVAVTLLTVGRLSDAAGRRPMLLAGLAMSAASAVAFLLAHGLALLFVGRVLSGVSAGIFTGTATAAIADAADDGPGGGARATLVATVANMGGLGLGPLLSGLLAQEAGDPLHVVFVVDLVLVACAAVAVWWAPETVAGADVGAMLRVRPQRPAVPAEARGVFAGAAIGGFAGFAVLGLCTALVPGVLGEVLGIDSRATVGVVVFSVFVASAAGQVAVGRLPQRTALLGGCAGLVAGMGLLALALALSSLTLLVVGIMVAGAGQGMSLRAGLGAVTAVTPAAQRAETSSAFFIVAYVAISGPVIGVGGLAQAWNLRDAGLVFTALVAALAVGAGVLLERRTGSAAGS